LVSLLFFSFEVIFKLKVVWQNIVQNFEFITFFGGVQGSNPGPCIYLCVIFINWDKLTRTKLWIYYEL